MYTFDMVVDSEESVVVSFRMDKAESVRFKEHCENKYPGLKKTDVLRLLVKVEMGQLSKKGLRTFNTVETVKVPEANKKLISYLTESEMAALEKYLERLGITKSRFVVGLVRNAIRTEGEPPTREFAELANSTRLVSSVARNLNQIARRINSGVDVQDSDRVNVDATQKVIRKHIKKASRYIHSCAGRWDLDETKIEK